MAAVAFCGLGAMGEPMATRLLGAGHDLTVWNRTPAKAEALVAAGATLAASPAQAAEGAEAVITMLADPAALDAVVGGPDGIAWSIQPGATLIDMSTSGVAAVERIRRLLPEGVGMLDAPVLGTTPHAAAGELEVFVGGEADLYERWAPVLGALGPCRHVGPLGAGAAMKLVANATLGTTLAVLGEVLALAASMGLDPEATFDVLGLTPLAPQARRRRQAVLDGEFPRHFRLDLAAKDLSLVEAEASHGGVAMPVADATRRWYEEAVEAGWAERDYSAVIAFIAERSSDPTP
jgi:3-hydroxyisobutyrate dehydrogenase-like beta-hydroxyacid dehydrogenase